MQQIFGARGAEIQITDAPSDDASVKSVFVTVTDIKVEGTSLAGFTKQTIDLKAFQEGNVKSLFMTQLNSKTYGNLTMVLDADVDATGVSPGCYVLAMDNTTKYKLKSSGLVQINLTKSWRFLRERRRPLEWKIPPDDGGIFFGGNVGRVVHSASFKDMAGNSREEVIFGTVLSIISFEPESVAICEVVPP